jgi:hypothetical protein
MPENAIQKSQQNGTHLTTEQKALGSNPDVCASESGVFAFAKVKALP